MSIRCRTAAPALLAALFAVALPARLAAAAASRGGGSAVAASFRGRRQLLQSAASTGALESEASVANPIRKVVTLLENMAKKVDKEANEEKELYDKFSCYCKTGTADLSKTIGDSSAKVPALQSDIEEAESTLVKLKQDLKQHGADREAAKAAMEEATSLREKEHAAYVKESSELKGYVDSLAAAISALTSGMAGTGLVQLGAAATAVLRRAAAADAELTDDDRQSVLSFLSGVASGTQGYVPKGGEIVGILNEMKENLDKDLAAVNQHEEEAVKLYEDLIAAKTKEVKTLGASIEKKTARTGELQVEIVHMKNDLTDTQAALIQDQKFLKDLDSDCESKKIEYEERVKTRADELVAIRDTIKILNDDDALDLFKKTLPSPSFMQLQAGTEQARRSALLALHAKGPGRASRLDVRFLALALSGRKVDFSKVVKMIDDMVYLLAEEQSADDQKKDYCNTQIDSAEDKAKELSRDASDLEASIEERAAAIKELTADIALLNEGVAELDKSVTEATLQRKKENEEFTEVMSSDNAAKELLAFAKTRLQKFYAPKLAALSQLGAARGTSRFQTAKAVRRDAPAPPPETWGAYQKKTQESLGVMAMLDLLIKDLDHEMAQAEKQEEMSQKAYEELMTDSAAKRAKDQKSIRVKESSKADSEMLLTTEKGDLSAKKQEFMATTEFKAQLHGECDWLLQNFDLRKSARSEEVESLKGAKAVLAGADFSLLQAGSGRVGLLARHQPAAV